VNVSISRCTMLMQRLITLAFPDVPAQKAVVQMSQNLVQSHYVLG